MAQGKGPQDLKDMDLKSLARVFAIAGKDFGEGYTRCLEDIEYLMVNGKTYFGPSEGHAIGAYKRMVLKKVRNGIRALDNRYRR